MSLARKSAALGVCVALLAGAPAAPALADQVSRSSDPEVVALQESAVDNLRRAVRAARATYSQEIKDAKAQRKEGLAKPRAQRAAELRSASSKSDRRLARRTYTRAAAPVKQEYRTARLSAQARRTAAVDKALADYLVKTGKPGIAAALVTYREATAIAGATLELALKSGRDTLRTDTADERAQLVADLEDTTTESERNDAWLYFQAASAKDRKAYERSIASARATYASAMVEARRDFKAATGQSIKKLLKLPFRI